LILFNDNDPGACAWLRELIRGGHLPEGTVDERSIHDLRGPDLQGCRQVHLFAGIGGWAYALQLAGWPVARPVWTGSCPCQPFSSAGKCKGEADERHLWPDFLRLIRECRPATCFGEQVSGRDGCRWLTRVRHDLEAEGYAVGCADLPACSQAAPHKRNRLFWVADSGRLGAGQHHQLGQANGTGAAGVVAHARQANLEPSGRGPTRRMGNPGRDGLGRYAGTALGPQAEGQGEGVQSRASSVVAGLPGPVGGVGDAKHGRCQGRHPQDAQGQAADTTLPSGAGDFWSRFRIIPCRDGKLRRIPVEPGLYPLAPRIPGDVALLRGAGNSIVPQVAAAFVRAFLEAEAELAERA
jgi:DNA (cytosine-5)-methyltransferase 1